MYAYRRPSYFSGVYLNGDKLAFNKIMHDLHIVFDYWGGTVIELLTHSANVIIY